MSFHTGQHNTDMTTNNVLQFMQKTAKDKGLQDQLEQLLGCGDGDISSSVNLDPEESLALSQRAPSVIQLASSQGYQFSTEELMAVVEAFRQHQAGELSDQALAKRLGMKPGAVIRPEGILQLRRVANYLTKTYLGVELK